MDKDKWSSLVWVGIAFGICLGSLRLSLGEFHNPGPGFLSFGAGFLLGVLALIIHFQSRRIPSPEKKPNPFWVNKNRGFKMVLTVFALLGYAMGMDYLGFLLITFIFLAFLLKVIEPQRWSVALLGALSASAIAYCIFELLLQSQLPKGPFEIF